MATGEADVVECFSTFDTNNDGKVDIEELGTLIRALGKAPWEKEVTDLMNELGTESFTLDQFKSVCQRKFRKPIDLEKDMINAFKALDNTGKGLISTADLGLLLGTLGEPLSLEETRSLQNCLEVDTEGNISYEELVDTFLELRGKG